MMEFHFFLSTDSKIPLEEACSGEDVCADDNAICLHGYCVCDIMHYNNGEACGEYRHLWIILSY